MGDRKSRQGGAPCVNRATSKATFVLFCYHSGTNLYYWRSTVRRTHAENPQTSGRFLWFPDDDCIRCLPNVDPDSPLVRDAADKLVRRAYGLDMTDQTLVLVMTQVIGANLTNDEKRAHLTDLRRAHMIDEVCPQEISRPNLFQRDGDRKELFARRFRQRRRGHRTMRRRAHAYPCVHL
jgi:hypothetical protein